MQVPAVALEPAGQLHDHGVQDLLGRRGTGRAEGTDDEVRVEQVTDLGAAGRPPVDERG